MRLPTFAALALVLITSGCGTLAGTGPFAANSATSATALDSIPSNKKEFIQAVASRGVKLTEEQLTVIAQGRSVLPNGTFAARPAHKLTAEQNLTIHFKKHGHEFNPAITSEQEYLQRAMDLATGKRGKITFYFDTQSFNKGYQSNVVRWNAQTREMTALRPDGAVTTLYLNNKLESKRFVVVPQF